MQQQNVCGKSVAEQMFGAKMSMAKMLQRNYQMWPKRIKIHKALRIVPGTQYECLLNKHIKPSINIICYPILTWSGTGGYYPDMLSRPNIFIRNCKKLILNIKETYGFKEGTTEYTCEFKYRSTLLDMLLTSFGLCWMKDYAIVFFWRKGLIFG